MHYSETSSILDLVHRNTFFETCSQDEIEKIVELDTSLSYHAGEYIARQGTIDPSAFILLEGKVVLAKEEIPGITIAELEPGAMFGSVPFFTLTPRRTNVVAKTKAIVLRIDRPMIAKISPETVNKINLQFMKLLYERVHELNDTIGGLKRDLSEVCVSFKTMREEMEESTATAPSTKVVSSLLFACLDRMRI